MLEHILGMVINMWGFNFQTKVEAKKGGGRGVGKTIVNKMWLKIRFFF